MPNLYRVSGTVVCKDSQGQVIEIREVNEELSVGNNNNEALANYLEHATFSWSAEWKSVSRIQEIDRIFGYSIRALRIVRAE